MIIISAGTHTEQYPATNSNPKRILQTRTVCKAECLRLQALLEFAWLSHPFFGSLLTEKCVPALYIQLKLILTQGITYVNKLIKEPS